MGLLTTNQLQIMVKEQAVDKSDALAWHFHSGPQTTKMSTRPVCLGPRSEPKPTACEAGQRPSETKLRGQQQMTKDRRQQRDFPSLWISKLRLAKHKPHHEHYHGVSLNPEHYHDVSLTLNATLLWALLWTSHCCEPYPEHRIAVNTAMLCALPRTLHCCEHYPEHRHAVNLNLKTAMLWALPWTPHCCEHSHAVSLTPNTALLWALPWTLPCCEP